MKRYWGVEVQLHSFLTSVLEGGKEMKNRKQSKEQIPFIHALGGMNSLLSV
jgi:hypothetical protein